MSTPTHPGLRNTPNRKPAALELFGLDNSASTPAPASFSDAQADARAEGARAEAIARQAASPPAPPALAPALAPAPLQPLDTLLRPPATAPAATAPAATLPPAALPVTPSWAPAAPPAPAPTTATATTATSASTASLPVAPASLPKEAAGQPVPPKPPSSVAASPLYGPPPPAPSTSTIGKASGYVSTAFSTVGGLFSGLGGLMDMPVMLNAGQAPVMMTSASSSLGGLPPLVPVVAAPPPPAPSSSSASTHYPSILDDLPEASPPEASLPEAASPRPAGGATPSSKRKLPQYTPTRLGADSSKGLADSGSRPEVSWAVGNNSRKVRFDVQPVQPAFGDLGDGGGTPPGVKQSFAFAARESHNPPSSGAPSRSPAPASSHSGVEAAPTPAEPPSASSTGNILSNQQWSDFNGGENAGAAPTGDDPFACRSMASKPAEHRMSLSFGGGGSLRGGAARVAVKGAKSKRLPADRQTIGSTSSSAIAKVHHDHDHDQALSLVPDPSPINP